MVNATTMASEFIESLPKDQVPEKSKDFEGFMMVLSNNGDVGYAKVELIIRDFDTDSFLAKKQMLIDLVDAFNKKYGENRVEISMHDQYKSPGDLIKQYEYVSVESMSLLSKTLITIVQLHLKMCDHRDNTPLKRKY